MAGLEGRKRVDAVACDLAHKLWGGSWRAVSHTPVTEPIQGDFGHTSTREDAAHDDRKAA